MDELVIDARTENLHDVFDFLVKNLEPLGCDKKLVRQCKLCAEEVFLNVASYAYSPETGQVKIRIETTGKDRPEKLVFIFSDSGRPFDPLSEEKPDVESGLEDRQIGGLGIFLVMTTMDAVSYAYEGGRNILTMEKNLTVNKTREVA